MQMDITEVVITVVGLVFSAVVIPLVGAAFTWLKARTHNEALVSAMGEAQTVADSVVASLEANVVGGLKVKREDGKLSTEDIKVVAGSAVTMFVSDLSLRSLAVLKDNADDITAFVRNLIEARLAQYQK